MNITIYDIQEQLAKDLNIPLESINLFRTNLKPTFSRNLWIYFDQVSPIHPELLQLVFPWKQFKKNHIDLNDFMEVKNIFDEIDLTQNQSLSEKSEKMTILRNLHLSFIEDWWYEIAKLMDKDQETCDKINSEKLEYVMRMVTIQGERVRFDWLTAKIQIIKYFKAINRGQEPPGVEQQIVQQLEEIKIEEESKLEGEQQRITLQEIFQNIKEIANVDKKPRKISMALTQSSSPQSLLGQDNEAQDQEQLRHFVNAAIYSLKDVHFKIYKEFGPECLKEYMNIIIEALEWIKSDSFYETVLGAFLAVKEQCKVIQDILNEIQSSSESK